jgi:hypothetical protein
MNSVSAHLRHCDGGRAFIECAYGIRVQVSRQVGDASADFSRCTIGVSTDLSKSPLYEGLRRLRNRINPHRDFAQGSFRAKLKQPNARLHILIDLAPEILESIPSSFPTLTSPT